MASRLYYKTKKILKKYYLLMLILIVFIITMCIPIPYIIECPGNIIDLNTRIILNTKIKTDGSFNLTYVSEKKATIFTFLLSKLNNNWDAFEKSNSTGETSGKLMLENSISNATYVAYKSLNKDIKITDSNVVVAYKNSNALTDLEVGDIIKEVNNKPINNIEEYINVVNNSRVSDKLLIKTNDKEKYIEIQEKDGENNTYIYLLANNKYDVNVKTSFQGTESGASGGLMMALSIYSKLIDYDLTSNKIIAGTGTIEIDGTVGAIDGIKYKLNGAANNEVDVFFVPFDNYIEANKYMKINNYDFDLVSIKTFDDALNYLKSEK